MLNFSDELVWKTIGGHEFCSFKWTTQEQIFCKNEFNLTGFCSKQSCPLSNSRYATVIEKEGNFILYQKDNMNQNFPDTLWKKTILSRNYVKAIQQIDLRLVFWPKFFLFRVKQKLTKLTQGLIRNRILRIKSEAPLVKKKLHEIRTPNQEFKIQSKINLENIIESELINRLNFGVYGQLYQPLPIQKWKKFEKRKIPETFEFAFAQKTKTL